MGQALYRKYRSKRLDEIIGQEHITSTLANALKSNRISHAYLFTGPKGVGKTSIARILAHEINKLPYDETETNLDIIEIDAASNRRIDEIRELRERVHTAPSVAKYKVYIIDEVHMLTREAFNALLKTLEEPPEHVIFILATTEASKLPETIVSRTQRFNFRPISDDEIQKHLRFIANTEKIDITDNALQLIANHSGGSFRDSISLLDQVSNSVGQITENDIQRMLGIVPAESIESLLKCLQQGDVAHLVKNLEDLYLHGTSALQIAKQLNQQIRGQFIGDQITLNHRILTKLMHELVAVPTSHEPEVSLQITLIDATLATSQTSVQQLPQLIDNTDTEVVDSTTHVIEQYSEITDDQVVQLESAEPSSIWPRVLLEIKKYHNTLYSIARMARATTSPDSIVLEFDFPFHQKRVSEAKNKQIIIDVARRLTNKNYTVECVMNPKGTKSPGSNTLVNISNIFGSTEVLES